MLHDRKAVKYSSAVTPDIEEAFHHTHGQSLPKTTGTCKECNNVIRVIDQFIEQLCFIYIIAASSAKLIEVLTADENAHCHNHTSLQRTLLTRIIPFVRRRSKQKRRGISFKSFLQQPHGQGKQKSSPPCRFPTKDCLPGLDRCIVGNCFISVQPQCSHRP